MAGVLVTPWERHRDEIASILDERFWPMWWVEQRVADGSIALMHNDTAIIGVERREYPGGARELHGMFAAGDMAGIKELVAMACEAGAKAGCIVAAIESRIGWAKAFADLGFRTDRVRIIKDLSDGS